jgi:hypothetical protein
MTGPYLAAMANHLIYFLTAACCLWGTVSMGYGQGGCDFDPQWGFGGRVRPHIFTPTYRSHTVGNSAVEFLAEAQVRSTKLPGTTLQLNVGWVTARNESEMAPTAIEKGNLIEITAIPAYVRVTYEPFHPKLASTKRTYSRQPYVGLGMGTHYAWSTIFDHDGDPTLPNRKSRRNVHKQFLPVIEPCIGLLWRDTYCVANFGVEIGFQQSLGADLGPAGMQWSTEALTYVPQYNRRLPYQAFTITAFVIFQLQKGE